MTVITKKSVLEALPARKSVLMGQCPTPRHEERLNNVICTLKRNNRIVETQIVIGKDPETGVEFTTPYLRLVNHKNTQDIHRIKQEEALAVG